MRDDTRTRVQGRPIQPSPWSKTALIIGGGLVGLLIVDIAIRIALVFYFKYDPHYVNDWQVGWALANNLRGAREFGVPIYTDDHGFRIGPNDPRHTSHCDVLVLGDSFAQGVGLPAEQTVAELMKSRSGLTVCNTGVSAYGTDQEVLRFESAIRGGLVRPNSTVIMITYLNDFDDIRHHAFEVTPKPYYTVARDGALQLHLPSRIRLLVNDTALFRVLWRIFRHLRIVDAPAIYGSESDAAAIYCALIARTQALAVSRRCRFLLVYTTGKYSTEQTSRARTATVVKCSEQHGIQLVNLDADSAMAEPELFINHDFHWNAAGNTAAYERIEQALRKSPSVIDRGSPSLDKSDQGGI